MNEVDIFKEIVIHYASVNGSDVDSVINSFLYLHSFEGEICSEQMKELKELLFELLDNCSYINKVGERELFEDCVDWMDYTDYTCLSLFKSSFTTSDPKEREMFVTYANFYYNKVKDKIEQKKVKKKK